MLAALTTAGSVMAVTVDFESVALGVYASFSVDGVLFSADSGRTLIVANDAALGSHVGAAPGTHFLTNGSAVATTAVTFEFASTNYFGLQIGGLEGDQSLSAYDANDALLGSLALPHRVDAYYSLSFAGMTKVVMSDGPHIPPTGPDLYAIDNVTVGAVPEPASLTLFALGLFALGLSRRRMPVRESAA